MRQISWFFMLFFFVPLTAMAQNELVNFNGKPGELEKYLGQGKWSIVMIWAHNCHICNQEVHQYISFHEKHHKSDAQVIGLSVDGKEYLQQAETFIKRHNLNFTSLIGEPEVVARFFEELTGEAWFGTPTFLVYNPKGELRAQQVGAVPTELIENFIQRESTKSIP
jgi:peroxiredoxin